MQITLKNLALPFLLTGTVPAPANLRITEVTPESFRGTWDHGASDVSLYRITWAPVGSLDRMEVVPPLFFSFSFSSLTSYMGSCLEYILPVLPESIVSS